MRTTITLTHYAQETFTHYRQEKFSHDGKESLQSYEELFTNKRENLQPRNQNAFALHKVRTSI